MTLRPKASLVAPASRAPLFFRSYSNFDVVLSIDTLSGGGRYFSWRLTQKSLWVENHSRITAAAFVAGKSVWNATCCCPRR